MKLGSFFSRGNKVVSISAISDFNKHNRYKWVARKAKETPAGAKVLDAGAGTGLYRHLFSHCDYKSQDFCELADYSYDKIDYVCDINQIPVPDQSFDLILCTEVLEHVSEPIMVIEEFSRIVQRGGKILLSAPLGCGIHQEPHIYYGGFTPFWYQRFLPHFSFEIIEITPNGGFFKHYGQESARFLTYLFPEQRPQMLKILAFPFKVFLAGYFSVFMPIVCNFLDKFDKDRHFTVGYFVEAIKK